MFDWYPQYEYLFASVQLTLFMMGMGTNLTPHEFLHVLHKPTSFIAGLIAQVLVLPFLAVGLNHLFNIPPGPAVGMILVAAMPGGTLGKIFTYLGKGNIALSISMAVFTSMATLVTVPLMLRWLADEYIPADFAMPVAWVVRDVALFLLLPLAVGMGLRKVLPQQRHVIAKWAVRVGLVLVAVMVIGSIMSGRLSAAGTGWRVPAVVILFCLVGQQLSMVPFYFLPWPRADRLSVGVEVTMRNMNLALLLYSLFFSNSRDLGPGVLYVVLFYAGAAMVLGVPLIMNHRRLARREKPGAISPAS